MNYRNNIYDKEEEKQCKTSKPPTGLLKRNIVS